MPKLRRRLRANQAEINNLMMHSTESSGISQASSSHSMRDDNKTAMKLGKCEHFLLLSYQSRCTLVDSVLAY